MQRSRITSTPSSGLRSSARTSSRSSMIFVSTRRDSSSASRSFSSTRTRERSTPTRGLLLNESAPRADEMEQTAAPRGARTTTQRVGSSSRRDGSRPQHREVRGLFTPVLFRFGSQRERERRGLLHLELGAAVGARHDLAFHGVGSDGDVGIALGTLRHGFPLLAAREEKP